MTIASLTRRLRAGAADIYDIQQLRRLLAEEEHDAGGRPTLSGGDARTLLEDQRWPAEVVMIVATDSKLGIGVDNQLPWKLPEDLARFRRMTMGRPILMGRKTYESIGRPLPGRRTIVISRGPAIPGVETYDSPEGALHASGSGTVFVVGGSQIYAAMADRCDRIERTLVDGDHGCDAFFPINPAERFHLIRSTRHLGVTFETWVA